MAVDADRELAKKQGEPKAEPRAKKPATDAEAKPKPAAAPAPAPEPAAASDWLTRVEPKLVPGYTVALLFLFLGERVLSTYDWARYGLSGLGVLGVLACTVLRFMTAARATGERRSVEGTLAKLGAIGAVAIAIYFATTETGKNLLHISRAAPDTRERIEDALTVLWLGLLVIAVVPLVLGEMALFPMRRAARTEARRVTAATIAGLTLVFAALYTALVTYGVGELEMKADYSYFRTARPGDSTKHVAQGLTEPVKVVSFFPDLNDVGHEVEGYLRELARASSNIQPEFHDRLLVPAIAKDAKVTQDGVIVLEKGTQKETLNIGSDMKTAAAKLKTLDSDFQKSLLKVVRSQRTAYLTTGHGELNEAQGTAAAEGRVAKGFKKLLESQNYLVKELGIAQGLGNEVPNDATVIVVLGPNQAFLPEEVSALKRYADKGGKLFLALDPEAKVDLRPLAAIVDLSWDPAVLVNDKQYAARRRNPSDRANLVTNRFSSHASVSTLSRNSSRAAVIIPGAAALDKKDGTDAKIDFAVKSMADTFNDPNNNFEFDANSEKKSTYNLAAAVSRTVPGTAPGSTPGGKDKDKQPPNEMRAFVVGDADAFSDAALGWEPNVVFALDALRWLGGEESFSGEITSAEDVRIEHTKQKDLLWFYGTIFGAPSLVLGLGLLYTRRVRRRKAA